MKARSFAKVRSVYKAAQHGSELAVSRLSALDAGETTINAAYQDVRREEAGRCTTGLVDPDAAPKLPERATQQASATSGSWASTACSAAMPPRPPRCSA